MIWSILLGLALLTLGGIVGLFVGFALRPRAERFIESVTSFGWGA